MSGTATLDSFTGQWEQWRADRDRTLAEPYGILSITGINFLTAESVPFDGIPGRWSTSEDGPVVELAAGDELLDGAGTRLEGSYALGSLVGRPPQHFRTGRVAIEVFRKDGWDIVRPRDPEARLRTAFAGTPAYEPDQRWQLTGRWLPYSSPRSVQIGSVQARLGGPVDAPGEVEFVWDGRTHRLVAVPAHGAPGQVALLFRDATTGVTTYSAQRELLVTLPDSGDAVEIDFNRAYNKNCAYTDFAVCPLPPAGNVLDFAVEAGERIPHERLAGRD